MYEQFMLYSQVHSGGIVDTGDNVNTDNTLGKPYNSIHTDRRHALVVIYGGIDIHINSTPVAGIHQYIITDELSCMMTEYGGRKEGGYRFLRRFHMMMQV